MDNQLTTASPAEYDIYDVQGVFLIKLPIGKYVLNGLAWGSVEARHFVALIRETTGLDAKCNKMMTGEILS